MSENYVTRKEAAQYLRVEYGTLANWTNNKTKDRTLKHYKIGKKVLYRISDLDAFVKVETQKKAMMT